MPTSNNKKRIFWIVSGIIILFLLCIFFSPGFLHHQAPLNIHPISTTVLSTLDSKPTITLSTSDSKPAEMAILNIKSEIQSDGSIVKSAEISIDPMGIGSISITSPSQITMGESKIIKLQIIPSSVVTDQIEDESTNQSQTNNEEYIEINDELQIYPVMKAELNGINFQIISDENSEKPIVSTLPVEWIWSITPTSIGNQTLIITISVPIIIDVQQNLTSAQIIKNISLQIEVIEENIQPTNTPISTISRIKTNIVDDFSTIIAAVIGLIGVLLGLIFSKKAIKKVNKKNN